MRSYLAAQGYTRLHRREGNRLQVVQDRLRLTPERRDRLVEDLEAALQYGHGRVAVHLVDSGEELRFSADLQCPDCDLSYHEPSPGLFSFNSPVGACPVCRGFGRVIGVDYGLVIPDEEKTLREGAIKPWQTDSYRECQEDLLRFAGTRGIPVDVPWRALAEEHRRWVIEGEGSWGDGLWYGCRRFFDWLESKAYKMHIRVLLSRYRAYDSCPQCAGARLQPEALAWRLGTWEDAARVLPAPPILPGMNLHQLLLLPIERCHLFFAHLVLPAPFDQAAELLLTEIRSRLRFLLEVGLSYLTLDRQSRTLSGGEVQRINLTTALGTSLVNTLFVLDEPSIGLHPRDIGRVIGVLQRLRDAGNSLLVVEHDPQVMLAADRLLDIGPGPGTRGGEVIFFGPPSQIPAAAHSRTAAYLTGKAKVETAAASAPPPKQFLEILGAGANNLKRIDVRIPLNRLVCLTGVSGSGKSTLVQDVLYPALRKLQGLPTEAAGEHRELRGFEAIAEVVLVDQSPIGRTTRSNPASYVGAFDSIRRLFAALPLARERGYTAGTFSFNAGLGRCPTCTGSGFEHVEMQFLSDVYLRCPDCDGSRFRPEVLEVKLLGAGGVLPHSMADVLGMTVADALHFFASQKEIVRALEPLQAVGLDYLALGQPVPTLSGGEAQRLKLAGHLAAAHGRKGRSGNGALFLLDEPTTGLHFDDIAVLLQAFRRLLAEGHSLVIIEHNLDVIRAADWLIDLGPEGGDGGGEVVCTGTPATVARHPDSHTGRALREYAAAALPIVPSASQEQGAEPGDGKENHIAIRNAREHNLRGIDVMIPRESFTVITGVSGSGKSTLAFDILFAEGQRRYLESLNAYARQFVQPAARPNVDAVFGIPPTVAIEQRTSRGGRKSTVATLTEIYHFLRLLYVKIGTQHCPECDLPIEPQTRESILASILRDWRGKTVTLLAPLVTARKGIYTDLAKWAAGKGFSHLRVDGEFLPTTEWPRLDRFREHSIELPVGEIMPRPETEAELWSLLDRALDYGKGLVQILSTADPRNTVAFSTRRACPGCGRSFPEPDPRLFSFNSKHGWCPRCFGTGLLLPGFDAAQSGEEIHWNAGWEGEEKSCPDCDGSRLRPEALAITFRGSNIAGLTALPIDAAEEFFRNLNLQGREAAIARDILPEIASRLRFLSEVGLGYLGLDRAAPTLSGGEAQRIRLAAQLGSNLRGVCYILDEPTIGLHPRDNRMLLGTLEQLQKKGNTVVVVEHDEETIRRAGHVIDIGPGAGVNGGQLVATGSAAALERHPKSLTGAFLANPLRHPLTQRQPVDPQLPALEIVGACRHNLKDVQVAIPLGRLVGVSGVSGSGKSTLVRQVLHENLRRLLSAGKTKKVPSLHGCTAIRNWSAVDRVLEVDQTPIGKTPRSCPATYVGFWDAIRRLFAAAPEAKMRGFGPGRFSFNVRGGRCDTCDGQGVQKIEMNFLPDVSVLCETCGGARFTPETRLVTFKGKSIAEVLAMSVDEAAEFFSAQRAIHHPLQLLREIGLGYLTLGQPSPTLSGGEAQRIKLVTELAKAKPATAPIGRGGRAHAQTLYLLDEPTIGLHMADVEKLVRVLRRLASSGNSVLVIEHNLDVLAEVDWLIDLGPEGGDGGGRLLVAGTPETVAAASPQSPTGAFLAPFLEERSNDNLQHGRSATSGR